MENRDWLAELRKRLELHLFYKDRRMVTPEQKTMLDRIMADVEVFGVLKAREGFARGWKYFNASPDHQTKEDYPLPQRTRRVLREEPDPHSRFARWRYRDGLEYASDGDTMWDSTVNGTCWPATDQRIDLWASLKAEPYRTEDVPADEDNPWPEVEP